RNASFWFEKIELNRLRDVETDGLLAAAGWQAARVWEHELADEAADRIAVLVRDRQRGVREAAR
ncbi:MAG: very short patch repair endonuclease, partial [Actinobacteria bacterium]|nr:very short patch repair endonuclease [Actinomycetota bacterium]